MSRLLRARSGAWILVAAGVPLGAVGMHAQGSVQTRVVTGAGIGSFATPGVPGASLSVLGAPQLDAQGGVLVTCRFAGPGITFSSNDLGLFYFDKHGAGRLISRTGLDASGPASTGVPGTMFSATFFPRLRSDGGIVAVCFLSGADVDSTNSTGYWLGSASGVQLSIRSGVTDVPDVPGGRFYGFISGFPCVVSSVGMAFSGQMAVGPGNVTLDNYQGIWASRVDGSGALQLIARPAIVGGPGSPPLAGAAYARMNPLTLTMAGNGRAAFGGVLVDGVAGVDQTNDTVVVERRSDGTLGIVARQGSAAPGYSGIVFESLDVSALVQEGGVSIDSAGDVAFAEIDWSNPPTTGVSRIWRRRASGAYDLIAAMGVSAGAGVPAGVVGSFTTLLAPAMNSAGTVVFAGTVATPTGITVSGLWVCDPGTSVARLVLRSDMAGGAASPPGVPGGLFSTELPDRGSYRINARGQITVIWPLQDGVGGVTSANDSGLWAYDPTLGLMSVARAGDLVTVAPGVTSAIRNFGVFPGPSGDDDGRIRDLNDAGEVAYTAQFSDTAGVMLVSQLPGVGACCRGSTCVQTMSEQCVGTNTRFAGIGLSCGPAICCAADFNQSGRVDVQDIFAFLSSWFAGNPNAEADGGAGLSVRDIFAFLARWFAGC